MKAKFFLPIIYWSSIFLIIDGCKKDDYYERKSFTANTDIGAEWIYKNSCGKDDIYVLHRNERELANGAIERIRYEYDYENKTVGDEIDRTYIKLMDEEWVYRGDSTLPNGSMNIKASFEKGDFIYGLYEITDLKKNYKFNDEKIRCFYGEDDPSTKYQYIYISSKYEVVREYGRDHNARCLKDRELISVNF